MTVEQMRRTLVAEKVFSTAATVDESTLRIFWAARKSPEYARRLAELAE
jgi:hypothetical protein